MATTWIKSLHVKKDRSKSNAISTIIDYVENPNKTDNGRLISSYSCDSRVADEQFCISKHQYDDITGRDQGHRDVLAYHIRQSFKPGEVDAETANKIGYELAMSFTKGNHAFVVATHIDKSHIHNHIFLIPPLYPAIESLRISSVRVKRFAVSATCFALKTDCR